MVGKKNNKFSIIGASIFKKEKNGTIYNRGEKEGNIFIQYMGLIFFVFDF